MLELAHSMTLVHSRVPGRGSMAHSGGVGSTSGTFRKTVRSEVCCTDHSKKLAHSKAVEHSTQELVHNMPGLGRSKVPAAGSMARNMTSDV